MITKMFQILFTLTIFFFCYQNLKASTPSKMKLTKNWKFRKVGDAKWLEATVPGTIHTDLLNNGIIENPFFRLNEHNLQWIDKEDWEYQTFFDIPESDLLKDKIELSFLGLDTYSKIYLNDNLILQTDNMFREYKVECKNLLKIQNNSLLIRFESPITKGIEKYDAIDYTIPVSGNDLAEIGKVEENKKVSVFTRKAGYHFGWDWGPRLVTTGIWRSIIVKSWDTYKISDLFIKQNLIDKNAYLSAEIEIESNIDIKKSKIEIIVNKKLVKKLNQQLSTGKNNISIPFKIKNPNLWWPNGMGEQYLYNIEAKISYDSYSDKKSHRIGLRTVELITQPDSIGSSFYFNINGYPTFMKGANYIPQDIFLPRVKEHHYHHILESAADANMNMLRIWGGGIYENDIFYDLCDEKGLLVWQDFMFACAMFPGDSSFLENVKHEAIDNVKRLRNHPSIALWCGNNEILSAWEEWGWKRRVTKEQSKEKAEIVWNAYDNIFHKILPDVVEKYDKDRRYWSSSPSSELGEEANHHMGDLHYWGVWWGKEPFKTYEKIMPRFMSEFGFQSFPEFSTVKKYAIQEDFDIYSEVMKSHQRSSIGNETIEEYMLRDYKKPKDFESFLYVSHLLQADGISFGIEAHRRNRERCMGSLYWQINDCWPVASWSSIDYYGKWKALHYATKTSFAPLLISPKYNKENIQIFVVSDLLESIDAQLKIQLIDFNGNNLKSWEKKITIEDNSSKTFITLDKNELLKKYNANNILIYSQLISNEEVITQNIHYLAPFKELNLPVPGLTYSVTETENEFEVTIKTKNLSKNICISTNLPGNFTNNYFDLLPGEETTVNIKKCDNIDLDSFKNNLKIMTLVDSY